jgi:hypothetical protein
VNIVNHGSLNFDDKKIDFWAKSILVEFGGALTAGTPDDPIGKKGGEVTIHLYGTDTGEGIACMSEPGGTCMDGDMVLCGVPKDIWCSNPKPTMATNPGATCDPRELPNGVSDCFYRYIPPDDNIFKESGFFGQKVLALSYGGTLRLYGLKGATYPDTNPVPDDSGTSWVRLAKDVMPDDKKNDTELTLDRDIGKNGKNDNWKKGDRIVLTTTDYLPGHSELLEISKPVTDPKKITVQRINLKTNKTENKGVMYPHNGTAYDLSFIPGRLNLELDKAETRAAVGLLTRSIRIVSSDSNLPEGNDAVKLTCDYDCFPVSEGPEDYFGGHVMIRQGFKELKVQGVEFYQLGQGGRKGRYPMHLHLLRETKDAFVKDSSIHDSMTRFITVHATDGFLLARNVGYMSIGHGFYLEDGTETDNKLYSNLGVLARSAAMNDTWNPRNVPGILSSSKICTGAQPKKCKTNADCGTESCIDPPTFPFLSDWVHPTVFWMMNGWNDFEYNMAAGAGACGACYWPVLGTISGPSKNMAWKSYASIQKTLDNGGTAPIKKFKGNYCTTAMNSFNSTPDRAACHGVIDGSVRLEQIENPFAPAPEPDRAKETYYPIVGQTLPAYTQCEGICSNNKTMPCTKNDDCGMGGTCEPGADCSMVGKCAIDKRDRCTVTVLDRYTSSFNWVETNFSAIWLRPRWFLVQNSVITDVQNAGLTFVTGGDYTHSSVISGNWMLARKNVFIGNSQQGNAFASNAGPFVKGGLECKNPEINYCIYPEQGITIPLSNFGLNQRFFNIYDGPSLQDSNAYLDIKKTFIDDCPFENTNKQCNNSKWMYGRVLGMPGDQAKNMGYLPNAAIAWKQSNGFYYPPAFHSKNLFFDNRPSPHGVDIRHFVIEPLFEAETEHTWFRTNPDVKMHYATWNETMFDNFTAIDRQTILNDDDGSLTGLANTVSVNEDPFFNAPVETTECLSDKTAKTSPYEHITTVVYPGCALDGKCGADKMACTTNDVCPCLRDVCDNTCDWCRNCTFGNPTAGHPTPCYGVPLYRQLRTESEENKSQGTKIRMMGPSVFGRINLTTNNGKYYISTTDGPSQQEDTHLRNIFRKGDKYYVFLVYAKPTAKQEYQIYVGANANLDANAPQNVEAVGANLATKALAFDSICTTLDSSICKKDPTTMTDFPEKWERKYNSATGILTVTMDLSDFETQFVNAKQDICQPGTFCHFDEMNKKCQCSSTLETELKTECDVGKICEEWAIKDIDCPVFMVGNHRPSRCIGFSFTIPEDGDFVANGTDHRPDTPCFDDFRGDWDVPWQQCVDKSLAEACADPANRPIPDTQFCTDNKTPACPTPTPAP